MDVITIILMIIVLILSVANMVLSRYRASKTTYEQLLKHSKELIAQGKYDKLKSYLMAHTKLVIIHYSDLMSTLSEAAAKSVDNRNI